MIKKIKLGLLTAVASAILALPVAASAETSSRGEPLPTTPRIEVINQVPQVITQVPQVISQVPIEIKGYLGTVDLLPEGVGTEFRELPEKFTYVKSIEITGPESYLVQAYTSYADDYPGKTKIWFYSLGSAATVKVKVTNYAGEWGYFIVKVSHPQIGHLFGSVHFFLPIGVSASYEFSLPEKFKYDVKYFTILGPSEGIYVKITNNGSKIFFNATKVTTTTINVKLYNSKGEWGYYLVSVSPLV